MRFPSSIVYSLLHDALVLFAMINAVGNLPVFADLTADMDRNTKWRTYNRAVLTAGSIVVVFAFFGNWMLQWFFQVDVGAFKVAGGILVFFTAARGMVLGSSRATLPPQFLQNDVGVFPMGFPFLAGPGTIVTTILLMQTGGAWITATAAVLVYASILPILYLTSIINRAKGQLAVLVASRILYIFICAKAVSFILAGLRSSLALPPDI
jgi:multiple antibiotic resistance protein